MAKFYGNLKGSRGEATRCGTGSSGLSVSARTWNGSLSIELSEDSSGAEFWTLRVGEGSTVGGRIVAEGRVQDLPFVTGFTVHTGRG